MATDLIEFLFTEILKISQTTLDKYSTLSDQTVYLFLIPHVILFLFLYAFSFGIVTRVTGPHKGFSYLVGIVSYIYVVYAGWYGRLVTWFVGWIYIALGMALFLFFVSIVFHPSATTAGMKMVGEVGKTLAKNKAKENEKRAIQEEVDSIKKQIGALNSEISNSGIEPGARAYLQMQKANLEAQRRALESKL